MNRNVRSDCPLCRGGQAKSTFHPCVWGGREDERFVHCHECDAVFLEPFPAGEALDRFYVRDFGTYMLGRSPEIEGHDLSRQYENLSARELPLRTPVLAKHLVDDSVLEIGASTGFFLDHLRNEGRECHGVEPSEAYAAFARSQGNLIYGDLGHVDGQYDNVVHHYVLDMCQIRSRS